RLALQTRYLFIDVDVRMFAVHAVVELAQFLDLPFEVGYRLFKIEKDVHAASRQIAGISGLQSRSCQFIRLRPLISRSRFAARQGMRRLHRAPQSIACNMRIDLRRRDVGMTKKRLHASKIRSAFHKMRGEGMTQNVRRQTRWVEARFYREVFQQLMTATPGEMTLSPTRGKQKARCSGRGLGFTRQKMLPHGEIRLDCFSCGNPQRRDALASTLALDMDEAFIGPYRRQRK